MKTMNYDRWRISKWMAIAVALMTGWLASAVRPAVAQDPPADVPGGEAAAVDEVDPDNPVLVTVRESNPTTRSELVRAIEMLLRIKARQEAKKYLAKLIAAGGNEQELADLVKDHRAGIFVRIGREEALQPEGAQYVRAVLEACAKYARDPARIDDLIKELSSPDEFVRRNAVLNLRNAQEAAVNPMLKVLADPARAGEHYYVRWGLRQLRAPAIEPLLGAVQTPDDALKAQVIEVLGAMGARRALTFLVRPYVADDADPQLRRAAARALEQIVGLLPDRRDAERYLLKQLQTYIKGAMPLVPDHNGLIRLWHWNPEKNEVVPIMHLGADAARVAAGHAAAELYLLRPDNPAYRRYYLRTMLSSAKIVAGLDRRLPDGEGTVREMARKMGPEAVEEVLDSAVREGDVMAAIGAAEVLGDFGNAALLASTDGQPRPLTEALRHPDRRLRLAAADAIMRIDPTEPYAGSSFLPEALGFFAGTVGLRRALVGHHRPSEAQTLVGMLSHMGFDADAAYTGRMTFLKAVNSPDYEFILISDALDLPQVTELLQMLRRDRRTAALPVGIMARVERLNTLKDQMSFDPLTEVFPVPRDDRSMNFQARRLLQMAGRHLVPYDERIVQAVVALDYFAQLAGDGEKYAMYDVLRQETAVEAALYLPELTERAANVLGLIGSPQAQRALVDFASRNALPLKQRQAAVDGFAQAVSRRGVLLTIPLIELQYERYNKSETQPPETQQVLGAILDTIEAAHKRHEQAHAEADAAAPEAKALDS
jgi:HEAT repeat protein